MTRVAQVDRPYVAVDRDGSTVPVGVVDIPSGGGVQLAGDLGNSSAIPRVISITGAAGRVPIDCAEVDWLSDGQGGTTSINATFATPTEGENVALSFPLPNNASTRLDVLVSATAADHSDAASFSLSMAYLVAGGIAGPVGAPTVNDARATAGAASWTARVSNSGANAEILVTGASLSRWRIVLQAVSEV